LNEVEAVQNQYPFICSRNAFSMGYPLADPITESIPHLGHRAVVPESRPSTSSIQSEIFAGPKTARQ